MFNIFTKEDKIICIEKWGEESQKIKTIEECAELQVELLHSFTKGKTQKRKIIDEIADVIIMCEQMSFIYGEDEVNARIEFKKERLYKKIYDGKN